MNRTYTALGVLLIVAALTLPAAFGWDAEPAPSPSDLTDAQVAAQTAQQEQDCADGVGPNYIFFARADGNNVCRDGSLP